MTDKMKDNAAAQEGVDPKIYGAHVNVMEGFLLLEQGIRHLAGCMKDGNFEEALNMINIQGLLTVAVRSQVKILAEHPEEARRLLKAKAPRHLSDVVDQRTSPGNN